MERKGGRGFSISRGFQSKAVTRVEVKEEGRKQRPVGGGRGGEPAKRESLRALGKREGGTPDRATRKRALRWPEKKKKGLAYHF